MRGLSPCRDQPNKTIGQHLRPFEVLLCWVAWGEHGWRALAKMFEIVTGGNCLSAICLAAVRTLLFVAGMYDWVVVQVGKVTA